MDFQISNGVLVNAESDVYDKLQNDTERDKWLSVTNAAFVKLTADGVDVDVAAEQAILKADSDFMFEAITVPANALMFSDTQIKLQFAKQDDDEETISQLEMVGYSGGVIKDHWWWDDLAIDLDGVQFKAEKFPILENHDTDRKVAFTGKLVVDENGIAADPKTTVFLENDIATEFIENSKKGFPYQSSIYVQPTSIERVEKDQEVEVNGFTLKGPGTVFRKCEFKEMSVCVFGWDSNTNATAFNKGIVLGKGCDVSNKKSEQVFDDDQSSHNDKPETEDVIMDVTKLKADHPEVYAEVFSLGEVSGTETADKKLGEQRDAFDVKFATVNDRVLQFEKAETLRSERELQQDAHNIVTVKLAKSDVPEHLHEKVRKLISYSKFIEDSKLDRVKFAEAIDTEIESWVTAGVSTAVLGSGFSSDDDSVAEATKLSESIESAIDDMLTLV